MPYETDFDTAFTVLLGKAQNTGVVTTPVPTPTAPSTPTVATSYTIMFQFGGAGEALEPERVDPLLIEVPDPGEIVWARMYTGDVNGTPVASTATVELHKTRYDTFAGRTPVYGSGSPPRLQGDSQSQSTLVGWNPHFESGQILIARLTAYTGSATFLTLAIKVRRDYAVQNQLAVLDGSGNNVLDAFGNPVVYPT